MSGRDRQELTRASEASTERMSQFALVESTKAAWSSPALLGRSAVYWISPAVCHRASTFCLGSDTGHMLQQANIKQGKKEKVAPQNPLKIFPEHQEAQYFPKHNLD